MIKFCALFSKIIHGTKMVKWPLRLENPFLMHILLLEIKISMSESQCCSHQLHWPNLKTKWDQISGWCWTLNLYKLLFQLKVKLICEIHFYLSPTTKARTSFHSWISCDLTRISLSFCWIRIQPNFDTGLDQGK